MTARWCRRDDSGSLASALLFVLIGMSLSALLGPVVVAQVSSTRREIGRVHALHAAMAGLESAVGAIRAALAPDGQSGSLTKLPACGGSLSGATGDGPAWYRVSLNYLDDDPVGQTEQWARDHALCSTGTPATTPRYALLVSTGTSTAAGGSRGGPARTLYATYTFQTTDQPPPGSLIRSLNGNPSTVPLCIDAGPRPWNAGLKLTMRQCAPGLPQQTFAYNRDLTLSLPAAMSDALPLGLCVDAGATHAVHNEVRLENCEATAPAGHQWSFNGSGNFAGTSNGTTLDGFCLNIELPDSLGSELELGREADGDCDDVDADNQVFGPYAKVGAGSANPPNNTGQVVNAEQFGRCIDVPNGRNNLGHLIAWPCKQSPNGGYRGWNQEWFQPALTMSTHTCGGDDHIPCGKGTITVVAPAGKTTPAGTYCLHSPGASGAGRYADILNECPDGTPPTDLTWTVYGKTRDPLTSYHIVDHLGACLTVSLTDLYQFGEKVGKLVMMPCTDSTLQMWNAPANVTDPSPLKGIREQ